MVGESVEEERTFSAMNFIKDLTRNRLEEEHLIGAVRAFVMRRMFPFDDFPFEQAFDTWTEKCTRRNALLH